jgi:hypothetical protein
MRGPAKGWPAQTAAGSGGFAPRSGGPGVTPRDNTSSRKIRQLLVANAYSLPAASVRLAWASAVREPRWTTVPSHRSGPVAAVMPRRNLTVRSCDV